MSNVSAVQIPENLYNAATRAVFVLQYSTPRAVYFVQSEVPGTDEATARYAIAYTARPKFKGTAKK